MDGSDMRGFWNRRAAEDPFFFVDNRLAYRSPDRERFWAEGEADLNNLLGALEVTIESTDRVVEVGCGVGRLTRVIAPRAAHTLAVDVSERMLEIARFENPGLPGVDWVLGDGRSLRGVDAASADACISHVVFQHIPDPQVTLGYVRDMGRVLRPEGWAAFQVSNDPRVHRPPPAHSRLRERLAGTLGRGPRGQADPAWLGSAVDLDELRAAAATGGMDVDRVVGAGTQFCLVLTRRHG